MLTGDEDESGGQLFENNHTLSLVSSGEDDSDGSGLQRRSQSPLLLGEKLFGSSSGRPEKEITKIRFGSTEHSEIGFQQFSDA